jgi:hypothetical protein
MPAVPERLFESVRLCSESRLYAQLLHNSIFATISDHTTQTQFAAAEQSIRDLGQRLSETLDPLHFAALTGTHQCIPEVAELACAFLANVAILQPEPPQPPAPPPMQPPLTPDAVVNNRGPWPKSRSAGRIPTWDRKFDTHHRSVPNDPATK